MGITVFKKKTKHWGPLYIWGKLKRRLDGAIQVARILNV